MTKNVYSDRPWWSDAVFYQIYPRSFADGNGDGTGDLIGIRERLDHLVDLGVDALWLSPFYRSPMADGGYDVADPCDVDPLFGTLEDFDALLAAAHERDIRVTIDIVPNHFSIEHEWFRAVLDGGRHTPERGYFVIRPGTGPDGALPPNNWPSVFGGPAWTRLPDGEWYLHLFDSSQPDVDWTNLDVWAEFERILRFWLDRGVDGFRVDVANSMAKEPGLPDMDLSVLERKPDGMTVPTVQDIRWDRDDVHPILQMFRRVLESYEGDRMAVGEAWVADPERLARYVRPDELNLAFNFELVDVGWGADRFRDAIDRSLRALAEVGAPCTWVLDNHDVDRAATRYGGGERGVARARGAALVQLSLPGAAYIYNGDELGLENVELPDDALQDPIWERTGRAERGRDGERVPLPWSGEEPPFGFTTSKETWLPMPAGWKSATAEVQADDPASTLTLYRTALRLRRELAELHTEPLEWIEAPAGCVAYRRGELTVVLNMSDESVPLPAGEVVLASQVIGDDLPRDAAVWVR